MSLRQSRQIEQDPEMSGRVLPSRCLYKNKNAAIPDAPIEVQCRLVPPGNNDPDWISDDGLAMRRDCPSMTFAGFMVMLQIFASLGWHFWGEDATTAVLQEGEHRRGKPIYMRQPREGFPGLQPGQLPELFILVYGLPDAPRGWWRAFTAKMLDMGFIQMSLDIAILVVYNIRAVHLSGCVILM